MEIEILHNVHGDKKKVFDTSTEHGRQQAAVTINKLMKSGTAIFLERKGGKTYRVKGYDAAKDMLIVDTDLHGKNKEVTTRGKKAKTAAVAPVAGGLKQWK